VLNTPEITRKLSPEERASGTSGQSVSSSVSSEPMKTNRKLKFSEMLDSEDLQLKIPALLDSRVSTPTKSSKVEPIDFIPDNPNRIDTGSREVKKYIDQVFNWIGKDRNLQENMIDIVC
jgi:hypothetical protein